MQLGKVFLLALFGCVLINSQQPPSTLQPSKAIALLKPSIVQISIAYRFTVAGRPVPIMGVRPLGSGFFADTDGHVFTNEHVTKLFHRFPNAVAEDVAKTGQQWDPASLHADLTIGIPISSQNIVHISGSFDQLPATILAEDQASDVAILTPRVNPFKGGSLPIVVNGKALPLPAVKVPLFTSPQPVDGEMIATSGFPLSITSLVTTIGWLSSVWFPAPQRELYDRTHWGDMWYLGDLKVNHGNSGGPVYRVKDGSVIGIAEAFVEAPLENPTGLNLKENSGLAVIVPIKFALDLLHKKAGS
jgi:S1-C subfamily serine protease